MEPLLLLLVLLLLPQTAAQGCGFRPQYEGAFASPPVAAQRIVGGWQSRPGKWPWVVSVQTVNLHFCGGAIVHPWWVLSAAHCFTKKRDMPIRVAAGGVQLGRSNMTRWVQKVILHPKYSTRTYDNDVALLLLQKPIPPTMYHSPVCLPDDSIVPDDNIWEDCHVAGWGLTRAGSTEGSAVLLEVQVDIIDWMRCYNWDRALTKNMLCAGREQGGRDACQGDSGGPLMCHPPASGRHLRWYEVGVVSWGRGCGASKKPGIYAKVANYDYWIKETAERNGQPFKVPQIPTRHPVVGGQQQWGSPPHGGHPQTEQELVDVDLDVEESGGLEPASLLSWTWSSLVLALIWFWYLH